MKIPAYVHYAIIIMLDMVMQGKGTTVKGDDIARRQNISFSFVAQILNKLKHAGLLESLRGGVTGGYRLKESSSRVTVEKIIEAIDPEFSISPGAGIKTGQPVDDMVRDFWQQLTIDINSRLGTTTIEDLARMVEVQK